MEFNIAQRTKNYLLDGNKKSDGLLHCSGLAHCAYSQIQQAMGEVRGDPADLIDLVVMHTGTMWHKVIQDMYGDWVWAETDVTTWLPEGWSGTIDGLIQRNGLNTLADIKTMNGEGMRFIKGVKPEHRWQISAYYWAMVRYYEEMKITGTPLNIQCLVYYMPVSRAKEYVAEPVEVLFDPLPRDIVLKEMEQRATDLQYYKDTGENLGSKMKPVISEKRANSGFKTIYEDNNWWVNYCPAKDCTCKVKPQKLGYRDPGGRINVTAGPHTALGIEQMIERQKNGS